MTRFIFIGAGLMTIALWIFGTAPAQAQASDMSTAGQAFARGRALFEERNFVGAIAQFEKAYELRPHYAVRCSIARCYENLNKPVEAAEQYQRCLREGAKIAPKANLVWRALKKVKAQIAQVEVLSPGTGGTVYIDGLIIGDAPQRVPLNPGEHMVEVRRVGAKSVSKQINTLGGEEQSVSLVPIPIFSKLESKPGPLVVDMVHQKHKPAPSSPSSAARNKFSPYGFWTAVGLTLAGVVTTTVLGVQTLRHRSDYEANPTEAGYNSFINRRLITNISLAISVAAAGTATVLFFYTDFRGEGQGTKTSPTSGSLAGGIGFQGAF